MAGPFQPPFYTFQGVNSELKTKNPGIFGLYSQDPYLTAPKRQKINQKGPQMISIDRMDNFFYHVISEFNSEFSW
jgi:hypothetical protein